MILESIEEVMMVMGASCQKCADHRGYFDEHYIEARAEGDSAIISCRWGDEFTAIKRFFTAEEDFRNLSDELIKVVSDTPIIKSFEEDYHRNLQEALRKAKIYASFARPDAKHEFEGFCGYCIKKVPMRVEKNTLWTSCSPCASIIADGAD